jgi:hypothetical protein
MTELIKNYKFNEEEMGKLFNAGDELSKDKISMV